MARDHRPTLHVIAGPNGAGKTTLYHNEIKHRFPEAEFINADLLAKKHYGHNAVTLEESQTGQRLAEERRRQLMTEGKSLVTESTFSHESKLELIRDAKAAGYAVTLYHVNVRSAELSVNRVASRVAEGGHPVPENKIRERYERNQALIHKATKLADRAYVFDNSKFEQPHTLAIELKQGKALRIGDNVPAWARELYASELAHFSPARVNRPAKSFADADSIVKQQLGEDARTFIPKRGGSYSGQIIAETDMHAVQKIGSHSAIAHFVSRLDRPLHVGDQTTVKYDFNGRASTTVANERGPYAVAADAWVRDPIEAPTKHPNLAHEMSKASTWLASARTKALDGGLKGNDLAAVVGKLQTRLAADLEHGRTIPPTLQQKTPDRPASGLER